MTHVNVSAPKPSELREWLNVQELKLRAEFWEQRAMALIGEIENIYDHAKKTGHVEIWCHGDKLDLYTKGDGDGDDLIR